MRCVTHKTALFNGFVFHLSWRLCLALGYLCQGFSLSCLLLLFQGLCLVFGWLFVFNVVYFWPQSWNCKKKTEAHLYSLTCIITLLYLPFFPLSSCPFLLLPSPLLSPSLLFLSPFLPPFFLSPSFLPSFPLPLQSFSLALLSLHPSHTGIPHSKRIFWAIVSRLTTSFPEQSQVLISKL